MSRIEINLDEESRKLWKAVGNLVDLLPGGWVLVGGLMVQLHALEHGMVDVRLTRDIDVLGQARRRASGVARGPSVSPVARRRSPARRS